MLNYKKMTNVPTQRNQQQQNNVDAGTGGGTAAEAGGVGLVITSNKVSLHSIAMLEKLKMLNPRGRKLIIFKPKF